MQLLFKLCDNTCMFCMCVFPQSTGKELPDETHMRIRRDILASILKDIHVLYPCKSQLKSKRVY